MESTGGLEPEVEARVALLLGRRPRLLRYFLGGCGSWDEAEDLLGELTWRALSRPAPEAPEACWDWLRSQARDLLGKWLRRRRRDLARLAPDSGPDGPAEPLVERLPDPGRGAEETVLAAALMAQLGDAVGRLSPRQQTLLTALARGATVQRLVRAGLGSRAVLRRELLRARRRLLAGLGADLQVEVQRLLGPLAPPPTPPASAGRPPAAWRRRTWGGRRPDGGSAA